MLNRRSLLTFRTLAKALKLLFITALLAVALGTAPTQPTQAETTVPVGAVSPAGLLNPDYTLDLSTGFEGMLDSSDWRVTLDGERGPVIKPASRSAAASAPGWLALPNNGLDRMVWALAVVGSDLYVGGGFTKSGDGSLTNLGRIARYDTTDSTWHALSNGGLSGEVRALAAVGSDLYAGGHFTQTADGSLTNLGRIARYDTNAGTWHALPNEGLDSVVWALAVSGSDLYVGGDFTQSGDGSMANLGRIARYDTTADTWHALPKQGLNWYVFVLEMVGSDLYVGGLFTQTGDGSLTNLGHIARYDTTATTWHAFSNQGLNDGVYALATSGSDLYVGGNFTQTGDGSLTSLSCIARYDTTAETWHALPNEGLDDYVIAMAAVGSDLYMGGTFTQTADGSLTDLGRIARYDTLTTTWYALPNEGLNGWVNALAVSDSDLYMGGYFWQTGDGALALRYIARYGDYHQVCLPLVLRQ
jgi:N-acetylneuraminic acid mutarotase